MVPGIRGRNWDREWREGSSIEARHTFFGAEPKSPIAIQQHAPHLIIGEAILLRPACESSSIEAGYATARGEPDVPLCILHHAAHRWTTEAFDGGEVVERVAIIAHHSVLFSTEPDVAILVLEDAADELADPGGCYSVVHRAGIRRVGQLRCWRRRHST